MRVDAGDFRVLDASSGLLRPLVGGDFQAWAFPGRTAREGEECHFWRFGVRMGPHASGELPRRIYDLFATPPGVRMAGYREVMEAIRCKGQAGYPPSVAIDALLGFSAMAYQSAKLPFGRREGI